MPRVMAERRKARAHASAAGQKGAESARHEALGALKSSPENAVASIAQSGNDIGVLIETVVHGCCRD